jgi:uncharacterized protein
MDVDRDTLLVELLGLRPDLERAGVTHVALFGSRARRDNRPDSDIDLLIDVDDRHKFSLLDMVGVASRVEDSCGWRRIYSCGGASMLIS